MKHNLKISVSKEPQTSGIVSCKSVTFREKFMRGLFGEKKKVTVLIPGDSVEEIAICETKKGENENDERTDSAEGHGRFERFE